MTDDDKISRRYRELPREEPPRHLDDAILASARRAVHTRPAPLVVPTGRQRWYFPLAAAAIIVLAVAVTMHVEREQPAEELVTAQTAPPDAPSSARELMREAAPAAPAEKPKPAPQPERRRKAEVADSADLRDKPAAAEAPRELQKAPEPAVGALMGRAEAPKAAAEAAPAPAPQSKSPAKVQAVITPKPELQRRADQGARSGPMLSASAVQSPEQWLQGIADLRSQGWHEEADRQLAEFRKRYPDYKIPETMLRKVERPR